MDFRSDSEDEHYWEDDVRLTYFLSLRTDLSRGDLRCLYIAWLSGLYYYECDEEEIEPPVPPGLKDLNSALINFADFLRVDSDLIEAAAINSSSLEDIIPSAVDLCTWIATLPIKVKDDLLANILAGSLKGDQTTVFQQSILFVKTWQAVKKEKKPEAKLRTAGELLKKADLVRQNRVRREAEQKAAELAETQRLQKIARDKRLNEIRGQEPLLWKQIESLTAEKKAKSYDKATELLIDLRDLAGQQEASAFQLKINKLKEKHSPKSAFIRRLQIFSQN